LQVGDSCAMQEEREREHMENCTKEVRNNLLGNYEDSEREEKCNFHRTPPDVEECTCIHACRSGRVIVKKFSIKRIPIVCTMRGIRKGLTDYDVEQ
jgi:preprotein translocase subunit Sec63